LRKYRLENFLARLTPLFRKTERERSLSFFELGKDRLDKLAYRRSEIVQALPAEIGVQRRRDHFDDLDIFRLQ